MGYFKTVQERINEFLSQFGRNYKNEPIFRLVWSTDQLENRYGTYNEFYNDVFLRTVQKTKLVPKYPYTKDRWIIERWADGSHFNSIELPDCKNGGYESIYVFEGPQKEYLEPILIVVQMVMYTFMHPRERGQIIADAKEEALRLDKELEQNIADLFDENYPIADKIHHGESVFIKSKEN